MRRYLAIIVTYIVDVPRDVLSVIRSDCDSSVWKNELGTRNREQGTGLQGTENREHREHRAHRAQGAYRAHWLFCVALTISFSENVPPFTCSIVARFSPNPIWITRLYCILLLNPYWNIFYLKSYRKKMQPFNSNIFQLTSFFNYCLL